LETVSSNGRKLSELRLMLVSSWSSLTAVSKGDSRKTIKMYSTRLFYLLLLLNLLKYSNIRRTFVEYHSSSLLHDTTRILPGRNEKKVYRWSNLLTFEYRRKPKHSQCPLSVLRCCSVFDSIENCVLFFFSFAVCESFCELNF
jgi:hypothetical protein